MPFPLSNLDKDFIEKHFNKMSFCWEEEFFLGVLESPRNKHDVYWAATALRAVGTERSIQPLMKLFTFPLHDVKCIAILTIAHIAREKATPVFSHALLDPGYRQKTYAMWAIKDAADERAIPSVVEYFSRNKLKLENGKLTNATFVNGVEFLSKHAENHTDVRAFLDNIPSFWNRISARERLELQKRLPELARKIEEDARYFTR